ncbi:MAG: MFS transporter [Alphaproteobacteria bacterium]|nr:MFS transporter [Alphaproteobacteria bacterium]MCY4319118.1 MFS transporter [Alphaproteobacteria bacterium]
MTGSASWYPVIRAAAAFLIMVVGTAGMFAGTVALKPMQEAFDISRGAATLPYMAFMVGFGLGSFWMGRVADRLGAMRITVAGGLTLGLGFWIAGHADEPWQAILAHGLPIGLMGASTTMAPMVADVSLWFERRRGLAVAVVISGAYVSGMVWPPVLEALTDAYGWRDMYLALGALTFLALPLLALVLRRPAPRTVLTGPLEAAGSARPLGMRAPVLQALLCCAGLGCCIAMAAPQVHAVAMADDIGLRPADGALMLSLMYGFGIVSRLGSGWISDRIGGLRTLTLGSAGQAVALLLFLPADGRLTLLVVAALFGLSQGGIVPSYAIIIREYFPARQAGGRIGMALLFTMLGMAIGAWLAGAIHDLTGSYRVAFAGAVAVNIGHLGLAAFLLQRAAAQRRMQARSFDVERCSSGDLR